MTYNLGSTASNNFSLLKSAASGATATVFINGQQLNSNYINNHYSPPTMYSDNRFVVVCAGSMHELPSTATLDDATQKAEELAHRNQSAAYVLKPVRRVEPKRDVITTDL